MRITGYYELIDLIVARLRAHCPTVTIGQEADYALDKYVQMPFAHITPISVSPNPRGSQIAFNIFVGEIVAQQTQDRENTLETELPSDGMTTALDVSMTALLSTLVPLIGKTTQVGNSFAELQGLPVFSAGIYEGVKRVAGWGGTVTFVFNPNASICS